VRPKPLFVATTVVAGLAAGALAVMAGAGAAAQQVAPARPEEELPRSVAPQPVAFSHRVHQEKASLRCDFCHPGAAKGDAATLPPPDSCLTCHRVIKAESPEVAKLAAVAEQGGRISWVPVYRVPDYVFFGHAPHVAAGLGCGECHGPVETRDVLQKEVSTSMNACLDCHRRRAAPQNCVACHQLGH
jgi:hypothetical protein